MTSAKLSEAVWKGIVSRIVSNRSTAAAEAKKYGQKAATVRGRVHEARLKGFRVEDPTTPPATPPVPTGNNPPVPSTLGAPSPAAPDNDGAARARAAAKIPAPSAAPGVPSPAPSPDIDAAARIADEEDRKLVLETYKGAKKGAVEILARRSGLDPAHALCAAAAEPSEIVKIVLSTNAGMIAPMIRGKLVGWPAVAGVLVFDAVVTMMAIRDVAVALGKAKPGAPPQAAAGAPPPAAGQRAA